MRRLALSVALLLAMPATGTAQALSGLADWTYTRNTTSGGGSGTTNGSFTQTYTGTYRSVLWDPRFMRYEGELSLRRQSMNLNEQNGRLSDTGYRFGATLFNGRPFPLQVSTLRSFGLESGNLPSGNALRGGLILPASGEIPELNTRTTASTVQWQLDTPRLPRVELGWRRSASEITAGDQTVAQRDRFLSAIASRRTGPLLNELRFQKTSIENEFSADFTQRLTEFAYDGNASIGPRLRTTSRAGYRKTYSLFDVPVRMTDVGQETFAAPARGDSAIKYAVQSVSWQTTRRLETDVTVSYDTSSSDNASTSAQLVSGIARYQIVRGLLVDATGSSGTRHQTLRGENTDAMTRFATSGLSYTSAIPHVQFGVSMRGGRGKATTEDGRTGNSSMWNGLSSVSSNIASIELGALYEKGRTTDDLLVFGNYAIERQRLTARTRIGPRGSVEANWEHSTQDRGRGAELFSTEMVTGTVSGSYMLSRAHRLIFNAGRFRNTYGTELESTKFATVGYEGQLTPLLRIAGNFRQENAIRRSLDQDGYIAFAQLEYRVRLFSFGLEQRLTNIDYRSPNRDAFQYQGNSFLVRLTRRFGLGF